MRADVRGARARERRRLDLSWAWPLALCAACGKTEEPRGGFEDRAKEAGIDFRMEYLPDEQGERFKVNLYDHGSGVAVSDVDGDGDDDVYLLNQLGSNALYRNDGKGRFTDVTKASGVGLGDRICVAAAFGDVDGDGDRDLYVTSTRGGNVFFRNRGDGTFEAGSREDEIAFVAHSETPTFFDADADGDLDLFVTNTAKWTLDLYGPEGKYYVGPDGLFELAARPIETNRFFRNRGDGRFEDATEHAGLAGVGWGGDTAVFDFDEDGDPDVFVANMFGRSLLFRNDGRGRFEDVTRGVLGKTSWGTVGAKAFDYDGDARLDLFLVDMHSDMWTDTGYDVTEVPHDRKYDAPWGPLVEEGLWTREKAQALADLVDLKPSEVVFGNTLFRALGGGRFEETSDRARVETFWPWGIATGDFDGDGFEDAYLPSGMGHPWAYVHSPLLVNRRDGTFSDRSSELGTEPPREGREMPADFGRGRVARSSRSAAVADFDGDGRLDLVVNNFNDRPYLLMNRLPRRRWAAVALEGTKSNRDAIGAVVRLRAGGRTLVRQVHAAGGYLAQSSNTVHFGLGDAPAIDAIEIRWPSGAVQTLERPAVDTRHAVREPAR